MPASIGDVCFATASPRDDARVCAALIYSSGVAIFEQSYGGASGAKRRSSSSKDDGPAPSPALAYIGYAFARDYGFVSYRLHTLAIVGDKIAGIGSLYTGEQLWRLSREEVFSVVRFFGVWRCLLVWRRTVEVGMVITTPADDEAYLANFAVAPQFRRRGVGRALVGALVQQAQALGVRALLLDVATTNTPAYRLYRGLGFLPHGKKLAAGIAGIPDTQPMRRDF